MGYLRALLLIGVLCGLLAACGSSGGSSSSSSSAASSTSSAAAAAAATSGVSDAVQAARVKAAACMRSQGINIPDPHPGNGSILAIYRIIGTYPNDKVQAAIKACNSEIRQAFPNATGLSPEQQAKARRAGLVFSQCMRAAGINFPDPSTAGSNPAGYYGAIGALPVGSPAFKTATANCRAQALKAVGG